LSKLRIEEVPETENLSLPGFLEMIGCRQPDYMAVIWPACSIRNLPDFADAFVGGELLAIFPLAPGEVAVNGF
jgi:hypothetical protein